ncbi:unnamed protein product [Trifolium pratense]|uniref:Uncharacterized protein n=1 Tax=Trifolium pratense TaxID=57577 RepID=A0ACB0M0R0_TRIPR|nr:unnamed protein product [Trifolium pratense]
MMNFDDTSNTSFHVDLDLGLALHDQYFDGHRKRESKKKEENPSKYNIAYPSLTLGPSNEEDEENTNYIILDSASKIESCDQNLLTSLSIESSFSNSTSMKKETCEELEVEVEIEKVPIPKVGNVDEDGNPRKKLRLTKEQSEVLEENFKEHSTLNPKQKQALAQKLNLQARQVEVWFQNRRARTKLKQTESDFEELKKCCETLTEENMKLQKELQELKSMQTVATTTTPFYMQIPAATLTICPSCETICGGNNNNNNGTTTLLIGSKGHGLYKNNDDNYQFPHSSSAAC